ncbi:hypothetical protein [Longivirga aurantiaca]|uniref:Uncharacterized protein n=1 Tax=Longivirga aurantiaca TaxID=1837743 RepID=A0ABW1T432_9ACTN
MNAQSLVERARAQLADGKTSAALRTAWQAVNQALLESNERPIRDLLPVAEALAAATEGREQGEADRLARYCRAVLDGVGGGVESPGVLDRLFGRGKA